MNQEQMPKKGETKTVMGLSARQGTELSVSASEARAKAEIEASYTVAFHRPRSTAQARSKILEACKRTRFAEIAKYMKPVGSGKVTGPSIRFAEEAAKAYGNIRTSIDTVYEDDDLRKIRVSATDLESNLQHSMEISLRKVVERRKIRDGMEVLGERTNTQGQTVFLIRATEDDLLNKTQALASKALRTVLLRLLPQDIIEEAMDQVQDTLREQIAKDPSKHLKALADAFNSVGVRPVDLEKYLGHDLDATTPAEIDELRALFNSIKNGETTWQEAVSGGGDESDEMKDGTATQAARLRTKLRKVSKEAKSEPSQEAPTDTGEVVMGAPAPPAVEKHDRKLAMTDGRVHIIEETAKKNGWGMDDLHDWIKRDYSPDGIKGIADHETYDKILAMLKELGPDDV